MTTAHAQDVTARIGAVPPELAALDGDGPEDAGKPTLGEFGKVLPVGYRDQDGDLHREFSLLDWDWDLEEELGDLAEKEKDMPMGVYISEIVGRGLEKLGVIDFTRLKRSQRRMVISQLYFGDALYIYIWIRIKALGHVLKLGDFTCGSGGCAHVIRGYAGDLRSLEVLAPETKDGEVPTRLVSVPEFSYAGAVRTQVEVGPLRWSFMETDDVGVLTNPAKFRVATLRNGIVGVPGAPEAPVHLTRDHLQALGVGAVNDLVDAIDEVGGGAVMQVGGQCPRCKGAYLREIDWSYERFFGRSSR